MGLGIELRYRIVDVFSDRPLAGNALCVVLDPCPEPVMLAIAREMNLSETTFPVVVDEREYEMRIFTPLAELPFAGHPSLGTAWVLGPGSWTQRTEGATVTVEATADGAGMSQPDPVLSQLPGSEGWLAEAAGNRHVIVARERGTLADAHSQPFALPPRTTTVSFLRPLDDHTLHVRAFVPGDRAFEDPGTGSLAGPAAVLARRLWHTAVDVDIRQGDEIGRPCRIQVHAEPGNLRVGGRVTPCAEGTLTL